MLALLQTCLSAYSQCNCPARRMRRSSTGLGSGYNKCLVWEHMIVDPHLSSYRAEPLSPMPIPHSPHLRSRDQSQLSTRWRGRVLSASDAPKNHSSRPAHVEWFAEDAALRGLVASLLLSIFGEEILVGMPGAVSLHLLQVVEEDILFRQPNPSFDPTVTSPCISLLFSTILAIQLLI